MFSAWVNHTDAKAINSLDTLIVTENGRSLVRHHLIDFNAALGSAGIGLRERRDGYEYLAEFGPYLKALPAFGFYVAPWMTIHYPKLRGIGRFESKPVRAGRVAASRAEPGVRAVAAGRHVLGRAQADGALRRSHPCCGQGRAVQRSACGSSSWPTR